MCETVAKRQPDDIDIRVGENLCRLRTEKGLSQFDLANALDVSVTQLQKYETGRNRMCAARLYRSAQALGVTLDDIFAGCGAPLAACNGQRMDARSNVPDEVLIFDALRRIEEPTTRKMLLSLIKALAAKH